MSESPKQSISKCPPASPTVKAASRRASLRRQSKSAVLKSGWLSKRAISGTIKNWKLRFFRLTGDTLSYYESETDFKPKGSVHIDARSEIESASDYGELCFALKTAEGVTLYAVAQSKAEYDSWMEILDHIIRSFKAARRSSSKRSSRSSLRPEGPPPSPTRRVSFHPNTSAPPLPSGPLVRSSSRKLIEAHDLHAQASNSEGTDSKSETVLPPPLSEKPRTPEAVKVKVFGAPIAAESVRKDARFARFTRMLKMHIPLPAIMMKMEAAGGFSKEEMDAFREDKPLVAAESVRKDARFARFTRMLKMHIPLAAIMMKMEAAGGFSKEEMDAFRDDKPLAGSAKIAHQDSVSLHVKKRHANRGKFMLADQIKFGALKRKTKKSKGPKLKRKFQRKILQRLHDIRAKNRAKRLQEVKMRERRASVFRPVVALDDSSKDFEHMDPLELQKRIMKRGVRTRTDALNYDKSIGGCPSGSRKASCVCRSNPNVIFLYKRRHPAFKITREDVQQDIDLMKKCTAAGLAQLPLVYTDVFDATVDDDPTFGFLMGNVASLMTAPYKPGTSHSSTVNNIEGRLKLLNFTQLNRAISDLVEIGKFTKTKYHIHDLQMLLQDEGPNDEIGHIWVIDPGELLPTKGKNQVFRLLKLCRSLRRQRTKSIVRFMHSLGDGESNKDTAVATKNGSSAPPGV